MSEIAEATRRRVRDRAGNRCEYCLSHQDYVLGRLQIDHIQPVAKGGSDDEDNLCLACELCNQYRWAKTHGRDPRDKRLRSFIHDGNDGPIILRGGQRVRKSPASPLAAARR